MNELHLCKQCHLRGVNFGKCELCDLQAQLKEARKVLGYYADEENYFYTGYAEDHSDVQGDYGKRARAYLEGLK